MRREDSDEARHGLGSGESRGAVVIRTESRADVEAIRALHAASFPTPVEAALVDALRAAGRLSLSLVAIDHAEVVGHVAFSPITVAGQPSGLGLAPVAVRVDCRRRGIAAQLIREGLEQSRSSGVGLVVVLGDPRYYARFGFQPAWLHALRDEYGGGDAFQVLELGRDAMPAQGGLVRYCPEFSSLGV